MQPTWSWEGSNLQRFQAAWETFVASRRMPLDTDPVVARSWLRCAPRLNPEGPPPCQRVPVSHLPDRRNSQRRLIEAARPEMEDVYQAIEGSRALVLLTDASLCLLEVVGHPAAQRMAASLGITPGLYFTENSLGTNGFALAHREGMPVAVVGAEHYFRWLHGLFTAGAPIHGGDGRVVGLVGLLGPAADGAPYVAGVVLGAARAIEASLGRLDLFDQLTQSEAVLQAVLDAVSEPVVLWDAGGRITHLNAHAARCLGVERRAVVGRPVNEQVELPAGALERLREGYVLGEVAARRRSAGSAEQEQVGELRARVKPLGFGADHRPVLFALILRESARDRDAASIPPADMPPELAGLSPYAQRIRKIVEAAQRGRGPVVVEGEFGLSREAVARLIHLGSERRFGPWVSLNCAGLAGDDLVAALAGRVSNSSLPPARNPVVMAQGGTLFLDNADMLPEEAQRTLLALLQPGHSLHLAGPAFDVRIMVGISKPLRALVHSGLWRKDLALALDCFTIDLRPLRERRSDLPAIIRFVLDRHAAAGLPRSTLSPDAQHLLLEYGWPGNTTELAHVLEQAAASAGGSVIQPHHLPPGLREQARGMRLPTRVRSVEEAELETILQAGWATGGRITQMAALLGISRTTVWRRLRDAGIHPSVFKEKPRPDWIPLTEDVAP